MKVLFLFDYLQWILFHCIFSPTLVRSSTAFVVYVVFGGLRIVLWSLLWLTSSRVIFENNEQRSFEPLTLLSKFSCIFLPFLCPLLFCVCREWVLGLYIRWRTIHNTADFLAISFLNRAIFCQFFSLEGIARHTRTYPSDPERPLTHLSWPDALSP